MRQCLALAKRPALNALLSSCRAPGLRCSSQRWRINLLHTGRPVIQAAKASQQRIDVAAGRQKDTKRLARTFKAVPLCVLTVSKGGTAAEALAEEYAEKIRRYTAFTATQLRTNPKKSADPEVAIQAEGAKILQALQPQDHVVALDERGRNVTSEGLAQLIAAAGDASAARLVCCIGGPFGFSQAVIDRADDVIKLSNMVLNHQVANIVLLEQLYRGYTILRGEKYHH